MTSLLFIVDHCQTLLGKFGFKQETNVCTTPYNSFVSCKPIYKITKNGKYNAIADMAWVKKMKQLHTIMNFLQYIEHDKNAVVHT